MPEDKKRSADVLANDVASMLQSDKGFRDLLSTSPTEAAERIKELAGAAKTEADISGVNMITAAEAKTAEAAASADKLVYVIAVSALGFVAILAVAGIFFIAAPQVSTLTAALISAAGGDANKLAAARVAFSVPDGLIALGSAAIGALAGLLGPLSQRKTSG